MNYEEAKHEVEDGMNKGYILRLDSYKACDTQKRLDDRVKELYEDGYALTDNATRGRLGFSRNQVMESPNGMHKVRLIIYEYIRIPFKLELPKGIVNIIIKRGTVDEMAHAMTTNDDWNLSIHQATSTKYDRLKQLKEMLSAEKMMNAESVEIGQSVKSSNGNQHKTIFFESKDTKGE